LTLEIPIQFIFDKMDIHSIYDISKNIKKFCLDDFPFR